MSLLKSDIEKLIQIKSKNTFKNHFLNSEFGQYVGEVKPNELLIWKPTVFMKSTYPIFNLLFNENQKLVKIKLQKNPQRVIFDYLALTFIIIFNSLIFYHSSTKYIIPQFFGVLFVYGIVSWILWKGEKVEKKIQIEEFKKDVKELELFLYPQVEKKLTEELNPPKNNEWTLSKTFTRIIFYPTSIAIIYFLTRFELMEGTERPLGVLFMIGVCGLYIIADLMNVLKIK